MKYKKLIISVAQKHGQTLNLEWVSIVERQYINCPIFIVTRCCVA